MSVSFDLNDRRFTSLMNSANGEVDPQTVFHYRQKGEIIWATYEGGQIRFGTLSGVMEGNMLRFTYQHMNHEGAFMTGNCETILSISDNRIRLNETWQWTSGDLSKGTSSLIEIQ